MIRRPRRLRFAPLAPAVAALAVTALLLWHQISGLFSTLALAFAAAVLVAAGLGWWNERRLFQPLSALVAGAGELANGRYRHRVEIPDHDELSALGHALNRLGQAIEHQLAVIEQERDHLRAILASMSEGVLVVGADRRAQLTNPAFQRLFGLSGDVAGRAVLEILRRPEIERLVEATLRSAEPGGDLGLEIEIEAGGGERRTIEVKSDVLFNEALLAGAVLVARDTTAVKRLDEMRRDFVANVSHELKTPLSAIRGFAETLRDGALAEPETAARFTGRILEHCRRLQALLNDLLTLGRLESVGERAGRVPVDLAAIARRAMEGVAPAAEERHVEMTFQAPPPAEGPLLVIGDADGLERMLLNLLANAIKYNRPDGAVHLRLSRQTLAAGGPGYLIEVEDSGIGIPAEALPRLFERFYRVDKGRSRDEGGTGLGLSIVKHVAQTHGGLVEVQSRPGLGSTFRVRLPA